MDEIEFYLKDLESRFKYLNRKKYYLSYSGGKDSHFLYWFIKEYLKDDQIEIVAVNTYMEHTAISKRMYDNADTILLPKFKPFEIKEKYGSPCFSKQQDEYIRRYQGGSRAKSTLDRVLAREESMHNISKKAREYVLSGSAHKISPYCCKYLKKEPLKEYEKTSCKKAILGVRGNESLTRKHKYKTCFTKDKKFTPLHDLSDELLENIYKKYRIEIPEIYNYIDRTGCMGCPYGSYKGYTKKELDLLSEQQRKFVIEYFKESYVVLGIDYKNKQLKLDFNEVKENE